MKIERLPITCTELHSQASSLEKNIIYETIEGTFTFVDEQVVCWWLPESMCRLLKEEKTNINNENIKGVSEDLVINLVRATIQEMK